MFTLTRGYEGAVRGVTRVLTLYTTGNSSAGSYQDHHVELFMSDWAFSPESLYSALPSALSCWRGFATESAGQM